MLRVRPHVLDVVRAQPGDGIFVRTDRPLNDALHRCIRCDPEVTNRDGEKPQHSGTHDRDQFQARMTGAENLLPQADGRADRMRMETFFVVMFQVNDRPGDGGDRFTQLQRREVEAVTGRPFQTQRTDNLVSTHERIGNRTARPRFPDQQFMRVRHHRCTIAFWWIDNRFNLISCLFHCRFHGSEEIGFAIELG